MGRDSTELGSEATIALRVRALFVIDASERAGIGPLSITHLHILLYLWNVLAPIADLPTFDGKVLKRRGSPFYPVVQAEIDRLVGIGLVQISNLGYVRESAGWRLSGSYALVQNVARKILKYAARFDEESKLISFMRELTLAVQGLSDSDFDRALTEDATYADPTIDIGNVVDFGEWNDRNYSLNATRQLTEVAQYDVTTAELLNFYIAHINRRLRSGSNA